MTNNPITTARVLHYKPRNTYYNVRHHDIQIKQSVSFLANIMSKLGIIKTPPSWLLGCVYEDQSSGKIYTRPYSMFDMDKWQIIK